MFIVPLFIITLSFCLYARFRGVDIFLLSAASCFLYFYPLILFQKIIFLSGGVINYSITNNAARAALICGILYLLASGLRAGRISANDGFSKFTVLKRHRRQANVLAICLILLMALVIAQNGLGLNGREKVDLMANLGYLYKIFLILKALTVAGAFVIDSWFLYIVAIAAAALDLSYGFRGGLVELTAAFFLTRLPRPGWHNVRYFALGISAVGVVIFAKESAYFSKDMTDVFLSLLDTHGESSFAALSLANAESASISAVFNEVVSQDFSIPYSYVSNSLVSILPFAESVGFKIVDFAGYFKGVLFGTEGDSFASGMLAVAYSLLGFWGVALSFYGLMRLSKFYIATMSRGAAATRILTVAIACVLLTLFYRGDLVYIVGVIRSMVVVIILLRIFDGLVATIGQQSRTSAM